LEGCPQSAREIAFRGTARDRLIVQVHEGISRAAIFGRDEYDSIFITSNIDAAGEF
jgi:hypothetical protein